MTIQRNMTDAEIDSIIINELKDAYALVAESNYDEGGVLMDRDEELLSAISKVLQYYMPIRRWIEWQEFVKTNNSVDY